MFPLREGLYSPFPLIPGERRPAGFSFQKEFGRKEGKRISNDLFHMLNERSEIHATGLDFVVPLSIAIFGKHDYGKGVEELVKTRLAMNITYPPKDKPEFKYNTIVSDELSRYEAAFGRCAITSEARRKALSDTKDYWINDYYDGYSVTAAVYAQRHLSMGCAIFWPEETTGRMLVKLKLAILEEWKGYKADGVFRPNFPNFVHAYKVLKEAI